MTRLAAAVLFALTLLPAGVAAASTWLQVEALPTLARAEDRARAWTSLFPDVSGFRLPSGWYAIALGPYTPDEAQRRLHALKAEGMIPGDSFLHDGSSYARQFWPVAAGGAAPGTPPESGTPDPAPGGGAAVPPGPGAAPVPQLPPPAGETPAEARRSESLLTREERQELQTALRFEGFYDAAIDGAFGPGTRAAMAAWQAARGHEPTGVLTTTERNELVTAYRGAVASLGLALVRDNTAGIAVQMPAALVTKGDYQPPFAHYVAKDGSGVQVILISQEGDAPALFGLYDILQTLEIIPLEGPRSRQERSFVIEGSNASGVAHAEARLTTAGHVKGFILIWPPGDEARRRMVLAAMQESFTPLADSVLRDSAGAGSVQDIDLLSGLEIRRPDVARTGFYLDPAGHVVTTADAVAGCGRLTLDGDVPARVLAQDAGLGLAVLRAEVPLSPLGHARFLPGEPRLGAEIAVPGYAYDGRLGAAVVNFGRLADVKDLQGSHDRQRLDLVVTSGEAGAPVLDGSGAVLGMLLPPRGGAEVLPESVAFALAAGRMVEWLAAQGLTPLPAESAGDLAPGALTALARDMTVMVSCWN